MNTILQSVLGGLTSWKTTLTGIVGAIAILLHTFGILTLTPEQQATIVAFTVLVIGFLSKDSDKSGKPSNG